MKKSYQLLLTALPGIFGLATPLLAQTYPRAIPGGYDRTNETDNVNYKNLTAYKPCKPAEFIRSDLAFQGYEEARPSQGIGEVTYYYRTNNLSPTQPCPDLATKPESEQADHCIGRL